MLKSRFTKARTIRLIEAYSAGGGYDTYARLIARHLGKHIPGNPTVAVENMTGAGGLIAVNYLYSRAEPDGLTIGNWNGSLSLQQYMGLKGIEFDAPKFEWIGSAVRPTPDLHSRAQQRRDFFTRVVQSQKTGEAGRHGARDEHQ